MRGLRSFEAYGNFSLRLFLLVWFCHVRVHRTCNCFLKKKCIITFSTQTKIFFLCSEKWATDQRLQNLDVWDTKEDKTKMHCVAIHFDSIVGVVSFGGRRASINTRSIRTQCSKHMHTIAFQTRMCTSLKFLFTMRNKRSKLRVDKVLKNLHGQNCKTSDANSLRQ